MFAREARRFLPFASFAEQEEPAALFVVMQNVHTGMGSAPVTPLFEPVSWHPIRDRWRHGWSETPIPVSQKQPTINVSTVRIKSVVFRELLTNF